MAGLRRLVYRNPSLLTPCVHVCVCAGTCVPALSHVCVRPGGGRLLLRSVCLCTFSLEVGSLIEPGASCSGLCLTPEPWDTLASAPSLPQCQGWNVMRVSLGPHACAVCCVIYHWLIHPGPKRC